jgi:hypothetical protein
MESVMNPQQEADDVLQNVNNPLKVMQPGERVICEIKRHPFGLFGMYSFLGATIIVAITLVAVAPKLVTGMTAQTQAEFALGGLIICAIVGLFTYIAASVYKGNRWIVTSDSLTQINQISLFKKQTSQLSLANLEDVTVEQDGILPSMFGFGRLRAETAGERSKFVFEFCPNPSQYAKEIIATHEAYIAEKPDEMHTTNRAVANTSSFNQSYAVPPQYNPAQQASFNPVQQNPQQPVNQNPMPYDPTQQYAQSPPNQENGGWSQQQGPFNDQQ